MKRIAVLIFFAVLLFLALSKNIYSFIAEKLGLTLAYNAYFEIAQYIIVTIFLVGAFMKTIKFWQATRIFRNPGIIIIKSFELKNFETISHYLVVLLSLYQTELKYTIVFVLLTIIGICMELINADKRFFTLDKEDNIIDLRNNSHTFKVAEIHQNATNTTFKSTENQALSIDKNRLIYPDWKMIHRKKSAV